MPFTLAHPAAALPLIKLTRKPLCAAALIIGSLSPDFGYYLQAFQVATEAHTCLGSLLICIPTSLLVLLITYSIRYRISFLLPDTYQTLFLQIYPKSNNYSFIWQVAAWVWLGALTHIIWDSFTHSTGWSVHYFSTLQTPILGFTNSSIPAYKLLQHASSVLGLLLIAIHIYYRKINLPTTSYNERIKIFWLALISTTLVIALMHTYIKSTSSIFSNLPNLLVRWAFTAGSVFIILLGLTLWLVEFLPEYKQFRLKNSTDPLEI